MTLLKSGVSWPHEVAVWQELVAVSPSTLSLRPSPALPCLGDSGGPVLAGEVGREVVVGVISKGDAACASYTNAARVDAAMGEFIQPLINVVSAEFGSIGDRCYFAENCASELCLSPADAPDFPYCSRECTGAEACKAGLVCVADQAGKRLCQYQGPSPGAIGASCERHQECEFGLCASFAVDENATCSALCFPDDGASCPHGSVCAPIIGGDGVYGCAVQSE